ncbi:MAG TPA: 1-(5-phosphoribosyl)-5-[(5-phosphoribosylamino)methylideneamino]imidazole-4-carboxamide isomerase [Acidimicrobiales bacterium]|nr:1-(5-phosphoribosyl)-5-[(5-phosphoribosylamino)methylideneamino]imidazole-4-carboxamide isomerase [Acidimicrobiales bacterium]
MEVFPAIDLRHGKCVRLVEGDFERETVYGDDPVATARSFAAAGARWIHVVDLDAARTGEPVNRPVVAAIVEAVGAEVKVQTGGGIRSVGDAQDLLTRGVARVVVGTAAVEDPGLVGEISRRWPGKVAVGIDHRGGSVRLRGWTEDSGIPVEQLVRDVVAAGATAVVVTDIARDGRLEGPDSEGLASLLESTGAPIVASGGVSRIDDIEALAQIRAGGRRLEGVIVGRAIYEGRVDVRGALEAAVDR